MAMISYSNLNPCTKLDKNLVDAARRRSPCGHTAPHGHLLSRTIKEAKAKRRRHACPVSRGPATASFQREREEETEPLAAEQLQGKGTEAAGAGHSHPRWEGRQLVPPPRPMRGPTKARQICFELAKTKSKAQSYQEATEIDGEIEIKEELATKESEASEQSGEQRKEEKRARATEEIR